MNMDTVVAFATNPKTIEIPANIHIVNEDGGIVYYNIINNQDLIEQTSVDVQDDVEEHAPSSVADTIEEHAGKGDNQDQAATIQNDDKEAQNGKLLNIWENEMYISQQTECPTTEEKSDVTNTNVDDPSQLHVCSRCNASFATSRYLKSHLKRKCVRSKNEDNPLKCKYCSSSFKMKFQLNRHMMLHTGERPFKCESCPKTFLTKSHLKRHSVIHMPKDQLIHKCDRCEKVFAWASALESHMKSHLGEKRFKCGICGRMFLHLNSLRSHMTNRHTVNGKFTCVVCKSCFNEATELIVHMKTHSEQQSVKCDRCYAFFTSLNDLETHICTNFGGKPLICVKCKFECRDTNEYCNHSCMQTNANRKCGCCSKTFKSLWHLREHLITHTGEKPFQCKQCQNTFRRKRELEIHMTRHSTDKPFSCKNCSQTFTSENYLKQHQRNEHREKKFICEICDHAFMHKCSLTNHMSFHVRTGNTKFGKKYHRDDNMLVKELVDDRLAREKAQEDAQEDEDECTIPQDPSTDREYINGPNANIPKELGIVSSDVTSENVNVATYMKELNTPLSIPENTQQIFANRTIAEQITNSSIDIDVSNMTTMTTANATIKDDFAKAVIEPKTFLRNAEQDPTKITTIYETHADGNIIIRCASCFEEFKSQGALLRHRKESHHDGKPYQCDFCSRTFSVAANLSQHRSIHNVKRKYSCNQCGKSYKVTYKLREHLRVKHFENTDDLTDLELQLRSCSNHASKKDTVAAPVNSPGNLLNDHELNVSTSTPLNEGGDSVSAHHQQGVALNAVYEFEAMNSSVNDSDSTQQQEQQTLNLLQAAFNPNEIQDLQASKNVLSNIVFVSTNGDSPVGIRSNGHSSKRTDMAFLMNLSTLINQGGLK